MPALTFKATSFAARLAGHKPLFYDIDKLSLCATTPDVNVHFSGYVEAHGLVEDASHALGSFGVGQARLTCISLHAIKHLGVGEGGVVLTDNESTAHALREFREFGTVEFPSLNFRLSEMAAALGVSRLKRVDDEKDRKREIMARYREELDGYVRFQRYQEGMNPHLCVIMVKKPLELADKLKGMGIGTQRHYQPLDRLPNTDWYWQRCLSIPLYPQMTDGEQSEVIDGIKRSL